MSRSYSFDKFMQLADGAAALTASGIAQVSAANKIIDLGGANPRTDISGIVGSISRMDAVAVIDVAALVAANADNIYRINLMGSNNANGSSGQVLAALQLGNTALLPNGAATSTVGRYELLFTNYAADVTYEFVYLYVEVIGTGKSIQLSAFIAPLPEI